MLSLSWWVGICGLVKVSFSFLVTANLPFANLLNWPEKTVRTGFPWEISCPDRTSWRGDVQR